MLGPCRECEEQVSFTAKACPKCGAKDPTDPAIAVALGAIGTGLANLGCLLTLVVTIPVLILLFALGAC